MHANTKNIIGLHFDKVEVLSIEEERGLRQQIKYKCLCHACNNEFITYGRYLRHKRISHCGCLGKKPSFQHKNREDAIWNLLYNQTKCRHKKISNEELISLDEYKSICLDRCYYCNKEFSKKWVDKKAEKHHIENIAFVKCNGIDRLDSKIGYVKGNCVSCCFTCNAMKLELSEDEFIKHIIKILKHKGLI